MLLPLCREARLFSRGAVARLLFPGAASTATAAAAAVAVVAVAVVAGTVAAEEEAEDDEEDESRLACDEDRRRKSFLGCAPSSLPSWQMPPAPPPWPCKALASFCVVVGVVFARVLA